MANWESVIVDTDMMEPGRFYEVLTDKDAATLLIPAAPFNLHFMDKTFIHVQLTTQKSIEIWKVEKYMEQEKHTNITGVIQWFILQPSNQLIVNSNTPITGYIKFI